MSDHVWVEATVHPDDAKEISRKTDACSIRPDKLHVTLAFTKLKANHYPNFRSWINKHNEIRNHLLKLDLELPEKVTISGAAVFTQPEDPIGVLLVPHPDLTNLNEALTNSFGRENVDLTYPFVPHVTVYQPITSTEREVGRLIDLAYSLPEIRLDGLWLRAGRMCLPL